MQLTQQEYNTISSLISQQAGSLSARYLGAQKEDLVQAGWCIALRAMRSVDRTRPADDVRNYISRALKLSLLSVVIRTSHPASLPKSYECYMLGKGPIRPVWSVDTIGMPAEEQGEAALAREVEDAQRSRVDGDSLYGLADLIRRSCDGDPAVIEVLLTGAPASVVAPRRNLRPNALRRKVNRAKHWLRANA